jgi:glucose-6-phosphate 1-epimerase
VIHDDALNRTIDVIHHHQHNVVAWNPGPALSVSMTCRMMVIKPLFASKPACVTRRRKPAKKTFSPGADHQREKTLIAKKPRFRRGFFLRWLRCRLNHIQRVFRCGGGCAIHAPALAGEDDIQRGGICTTCSILAAFGIAITPG